MAGGPSLADVVRRLDALESREAIRGLAADYARMIDAKDLDGVTALFVEDVRVGDRTGRAAKLQAFMSNHGAQAHFRRTVHLVAGHSIELDRDDPDLARGTVYCRAEHEVGDLWVVAVIQYWDTYARRDGSWLFADRDIRTFYVADVLERPTGSPVKHRLTNTGATSTADLPQAWPTWDLFWASVETA